MPIGRFPLAAFGTTSSAVQEGLRSQDDTPITSLNPQAIEALRELTKHPQYKTDISPENQNMVKALLSSVGPDYRVYKYGKDYWKQGPLEFAQQKLVPFQGDEKFAPGEQSIYGDVFNRSGAGVRGAIRSLSAPETIKATEDNFFAGVPASIGAFKEGFAQPRSVEKYQSEELGDYYSQPGVLDDYERSAYLDSPIMKAMPKFIQEGVTNLDLLKYPKVLLGGGTHSAVGVLKDILTNPADLALMAMPTPAWAARAGAIPMGKGFTAGVKNVFRPAAAAASTRAGVASAEQAIRAGLKKPTGKQLEFPFAKKPTPAAVPPKPVSGKPIYEPSGQQIFPFAKPKPRAQGQLELPFVKAPKASVPKASVPKAAAPKGQQAFRFYRRGIKEGIPSPKIVEKPPIPKPSKVGVQPQFKTGDEPALLDFLNQHFTGHEVVRIPKAERVRLGNLPAAELRDAVAQIKNVKLPKVKPARSAKSVFGKKLQKQAIQGEEVPLHPAMEGKAAEASRKISPLRGKKDRIKGKEGKLKGKKGQADFGKEKEWRRKLRYYERLGSEYGEEQAAQYRQLLQNSKKQRLLEGKRGGVLFKPKKNQIAEWQQKVKQYKDLNTAYGNEQAAKYERLIQNALKESSLINARERDSKRRIRGKRGQADFGRDDKQSTFDDVIEGGFGKSVKGVVRREFNKDVDSTVGAFKKKKGMVYSEESSIMQAKLRAKNQARAALERKKQDIARFENVAGNAKGNRGEGEKAYRDFIRSSPSSKRFTKQELTDIYKNAKPIDRPPWSKKGIRGKKGQAEWSDMTPEQQAALKKALPKTGLAKIFGIKPDVESKAAPQIFKKGPTPSAALQRPSKQIGRVARDKASGNWGVIKRRLVEDGKEVFEVTGGSFGDEMVKLSRNEVNVLTRKKAAELPSTTFTRAEPVTPVKPKVAAPVTDPKAALKAQHKALGQQIVDLSAKKPELGTKEAIKLAHLRQQYRKIGKELTLSAAERSAATKEGRTLSERIKNIEGYESFAKPVKRLESERGAWSPGKRRKGPQIDKDADDMVSAFKNLLPEIIDDVNKHGGTVMDRVKAVTKDKAVIRMVEREIGNSAEAAKAEIVTKVGNWNVKNLDEKLRTGLQRMADEDPTIGAKGKVISDPEVKKIAENLTETPIMRAILKQKPGEFAGEVRKATDDAASALKAVLEEDLGPQGLMKELKKVVTTRFKQQKETTSRLGRAFRQLQLTADDKTAIKGLIEKVKMKYKRDPMMSAEDYAVIEKDLIKLQHDIFNTTKWSASFDKAYYVWLNSLLSNPYTHGVNFISNAAFLLEKIPNRAFDILGDYTLRGFSRMKGVKMKPAYQWKEIPAMFRGFSRWAHKKRTGQELPFKVKKGTKLDVDIPAPLSKSVDDIVGQPVRLLKKGDDIFKEMAGYAEFYARHVMGERGETLLNSIHKEQLLRTFQDETGPFAKALLGMKETVKGFRWIVPFIKTPERLLMRGLERIPVGAAGKLVRDLAKGAPQKAIAHDIGLVYESALLTAGVGWLWHNSKITGDAPDDRAEREAFYNSGKKPNAIKIGNLWVPFSRIEPIGSALSLMVNFTQDIANSDEEGIVNKVAGGIGGITQTLANKTYFSGALGFMRAASEPQIYGGRMLSKFVGSMAPGAVKFIADIMDPIYRDAEGLTGEFRKRVPFLSKTVEPSLGPLGEEQEKTFLGIGVEKTDRLTRALKDTPIPYLSERLGGEKLPKKEYNDILRKSAVYLRPALEALTSDPSWKRTPLGLRRRAVEKATRQIREAFRDMLHMEKIKEEIQTDPQGYIDSLLD